MEYDDPYQDIGDQDRFGSREVGLSHPDQPIFVRLRDNGDIEIVGGEGLGILMNKATSTITLVADNIKFLTRRDGLRWNKHRFNFNATTFNDPTLLQVDDTSGENHLYRDVDYFLNDDAEFTGLSVTTTEAFDVVSEVLDDVIDY